MKYDIHTKLLLELYQNEFGMIPVTIWYEYQTLVFAMYGYATLIPWKFVIKNQAL